MDKREMGTKTKIYRVRVDGRNPTLLIASEPKLRLWLGDKQFERLQKEGAVEEVKDEEDLVDG